MINLHEQDNLQGTPLLFHQNLSTANEVDDFHPKQMSPEAEVESFHL